MRTTVTMSPKLEKIITTLACLEDTTKCDIIRKSIALYNYLYDEVHKHHKRIIIITDNSGEAHDEIIL